MQRFVVLFVSGTICLAEPEARATPYPVPSATSHRPIFYSEQPRATPPSSPNGYSTYGVYPGLFRCEIEQRLGGALLSTQSFAIYPDGRGGSVNAYFHLRNLCYRVEGDVLEFQGTEVSSNQVTPNLENLTVFYDSSDKAVCYRLDADRKGRGEYLPLPGSSIRIIDFHKALWDSDTSTARQLLGLYPAILEARLLPAGDTAIHLATRRGHLALVSHLLKMGADANIPNFRGETPLSQARSDEMIRLLTDGGAEAEPIQR